MPPAGEARAFVAVRRVERDADRSTRRACRRVDGELAVDEHPDVVVAGEVEDLAAAVRERVVELAGEGEVVRRCRLHRSVCGFAAFQPRPSTGKNVVLLNW